MARIIRLTEQDLARIVRRVIMEQEVKMVQGSAWACYGGAEGPAPDYATMNGNEIEFFQDDSMMKSLGKVYLPKAQKTRGQFCGTPSQVGTSVVLTSDQGKYTCTTDCLPS
jgi:hypothetical protein